MAQRNWFYCNTRKTFDPRILERTLASRCKDSFDTLLPEWCKSSLDFDTASQSSDSCYPVLEVVALSVLWGKKNKLNSTKNNLKVILTYLEHNKLHWRFEFWCQLILCIYSHASISLCHKKLELALQTIINYIALCQLLITW